VPRAFEVLLGKLPESSSVPANTHFLYGGLLALSQLYSDILSSPAFAPVQQANPNPFGLTASST
jgi:hypothetical protein